LPLPADPAAGFGLYVHWPYCARICPYCDFNVHKTREVDATRWRRAFRTEMDACAAWHDGGAPLTSLYFGGGTPSLMTPDLVAGVIEDARAVFGLSDDAEVSLEANPSTGADYAALAEAGVTRLSLGIQAFDDDALRFLGRDHDAGAARASLADARAHFDKVTFDLIYGLPGQDLASWERALGDALAAAPTHLSLYQLTIEDGTAFAAARKRGDLVPPDDDALADLYEATQRIAEAAGLPGYEVSNHAASPEAQGRHNLTYWRYGAYAGIGPGAHGRLVREGRRVATETARAPDAWLHAVETEGHGVTGQEALDPAACGTELLLMGLRLAEGIPATRFEAVAGTPLESLGKNDAIASLVQQDLLMLDKTRLRATPAGRRVLNALVASLCDALSW